MTEWQFTALSSEAAENKYSMQRLIRAIALSKNQFSLILVRCNYQLLREQIIMNLRSLTTDINLRELVLSPSTNVLHSTIIADLYLDNPVITTDCLP